MSLTEFLKREAVLLISTALALLSVFFVPIDAEYISYIDLRVIALLFCLMTVVAGFTKSGLFSAMSAWLSDRSGKTRTIVFILVNITFFSAMLITNDVALLTLVPFTLGIIKDDKSRIYAIVLETLAANLGSALTPIGNPQNLFIYSHYEMPLSEFFAATAPLTVLSYIILCVMVLPIKDGECRKEEISCRPSKKGVAFYSVLFILCLLTVTRVLNFGILLFVILASVLVFDRSVLKKADYSLLLTFVMFFVFVGNMGRIELVKDFVSGILKGHEALIGVAASQVISNVPAAVMLSAFTKNARDLLIGVNVGGLGTLIASLASLISFRLYARAENARPTKYFWVFTLCNAAALVPLMIFVLVF